jgi:hypothetical protein
MVWFNAVDPLIGRSVGGVSWIFDWLKEGIIKNGVFSFTYKKYAAQMIYRYSLLR